MDVDFAECLLLYRSGNVSDCIAGLLNVLAARPDDADARFLLALIGDPAAPAGATDGLFDALMRPERRTGDDYDRLGQGLRAAGLEKLAEVAFRTAAALDRVDPHRPHAWGDTPFNGQARRADLFKRLVRLLDIEAVVETGTFRGTTTLFMHEASGVDVYSCELSDRYFEYAVARIGSAGGIHLYRQDSREFLARLGEDGGLTEKTVFFYLDAHWNAEFPLVEELRIICRHFARPIIMIDDFEVPDRADYDFDDYGEDAVLSIDILDPVLTEDMSLFYPNWVPDDAASSNRGFVILARGDIARRVATLTGYVGEFDRFHAVMRQMRRYRRTLRQIVSDHEAADRRNREDLEAARQDLRDTSQRLLATQQELRAEAELARSMAATAEARAHAAGDELRRAREAETAAKDELRRAREAETVARDELRRAGEAETAARDESRRAREAEAAVRRDLLAAGELARQTALTTGGELQAARDAIEREQARAAAAACEVQAARRENETSHLHLVMLQRQLASTRGMLTETTHAHRAAAEQLAELERQLTAIHRSTVWRRTRWLVRQVERARRARDRPLLETLGKARRIVFPPGSRRERGYAVLARPVLLALLRPGATGSAAVVEARPAPAGGDPALSWPDINLGPLKFIPHDGGFFSNFNFLVGEMYLGRIVYPLFSYEEATRYNASLKHFAYFDRDCENAWFEFFQPIAYSPDDDTHRQTERIADLPDTWGHLAAPEFRVPAATMRLYAREDFADWRVAVHDAVADKIRVADDIRETIDRMLALMPGRRIGVHVRHPSHMVEQGNIFFASYFEAIDAIRERQPLSSVFLATDNDLAIAAFRVRYGEALFCYPGFIRQSIDEVLEWAYTISHARTQVDDMGFVGGVGFQTHYKLAAAGGGSDGLRSGKEAVADVFTLAACDDFVCTASNFTLACAFLNPRQTLHLISKGVA
jgi:hypothetical protein